jgi:hypothetical protein
MKTTRSIARPLAPAAGFFVLWLLVAFVSYRLLWIPNDNRFDFYPRWLGARAVLNHASPYSDELTREIQIGMFGQPRAANQDQQRFAYPAWITWQLLPFWLLPFPIAVSLWCGLALLLLILLPLVVFALLGWRIPPIPLAVIVFFSVFVFRYPMIAYFFGQFIPFVLACFVIAWWGLARHQPTVAALALLLAMVRPEITLIPLGTLLVLAWQMKQRRVIGLWILGMFLLWLLTRVWIGAWELDFYRGLLAYRLYAIPVWAPGLLNNFGLSALLGLSVALWSVWMWFQVRRAEPAERIGWVLAVSILAALLLVPQTANYTMVMALAAVWFLFWMYRENYLDWLPLLLILAAPWFFSFLNNRWTDWERLLIPLALCLMLTHRWLFRRKILAMASVARG